ncbi:hypothetical protein OEZ86_006150 [Tetradesmus obliquus]|nr:hypothetical protein OEZ86_006150 [Tetradesmus obliquus]
MADETQALSLQWVYGLSNVPCNIINLSDEHNDRVVYAAAHTAVIYDKRTRKQTFLQGHCSAITCLAASENRSLLVSADAGKDSLLVFWDPASGQPTRTLQRPHAAGVAAVALSPDASQMATLSAVDSSSGVQELSLWDLRPLTASPGSSSLQPSATTPIPAGDVQSRICYNPDDPSELLTNGKRRAYFWHSQLPGSSLISYFSPPLRAGDFHQDVGDFVASVFVPGTTQALTSTADGDVVVWDEQGMSAQMGTRATDRRAIKVMRLHGAAIHHLSCIGGFVVTGAADGLVRFFDSMLRMCAWFEELDAGPVGCVSFATKGQQRPQAVMQMHRLAAPDFMVSTLTGKLLSVSSESFNTTDPDNPSGAELLLEAPACSITDIAAHPLRPELLLLDADSGQLLRWDLASRQCLAQRQLGQDVKAARLALARDGGFVVLVCAGGQLLVLKGDTLEEVVVLKNTRQPITRVSVSSSGRYIAAADGSGQVLLYGFLPYKGTFLKWDLVGKFRAHHKEVVGLHFGEAPSGQTRLFSLGADRRLLEYNLAAADAANAGLRALAVLDVVAPGGAGTPCSMCFAPPMPYYSHASMDTLLLVADDAFKIKAYNPDAKAASATYLGPTFGGPITKLLPFRSVTDGGAWLAYSTAEQVVGLIVWPLDGDPQHSMGVIAHPGEVKGLALSFDGRKLVTLGEQGILNVWDVNTAALGPPPSRQASFGSSSAAAAASKWAHLVGEPALLEELRDYFCYAQLLAQPQDTAGAYDITGRVPVSLLPDLMRAAGYYPSNADIDSLMAHVAFLAAMVPDDEAAISSSGGKPEAQSGSVAATAAAAAAGSQAGSRTGSASSSRLKQADAAAGQVQQQQDVQKSWQVAVPDGIDFDTFLCLYVNHRPVAEVSLQQIEQAFTTLGAGTAAGVLSSHRLLELLQQGGEAMSQEELLQALQILTGAVQPEDTLPEYVDARTFTSEQQWQQQWGGGILLADCQGLAVTPDNLGAGQLAVVNEFNTFEDALELAAELTGPCSTCVGEAVAAAVQMAIASALDESAAGWDIDARSLYYCSLKGRTCKTGWDIPDAFKHIVDTAPDLLRPTGCLESKYPELVDRNKEPDIIDWEPYCKAANETAADGKCTADKITRPKPLLKCSYRSLSNFYQMQQHIRKHGAIVSRIIMNDDWEVQFNETARNVSGLEWPPYKKNTTAKAVYGHAVALVGYNNQNYTWTGLNSWGKGSTNKDKEGITADGLFRINMGLAGVGTPEQTYGVACTVFPGNKKDLHGTPWLAKPRKPVSPINAAVALEVNANCYKYKTEANESVSTIVEWFDLDYRLFIQRNRKQFGNLQDVTYRLGQTKKARQLQNILDVVSNVTADLTTEKPYFTCTFYDKGGAASSVTCLSGNTQKCAQNGTVNCALRYKDVNVSLELAAGTIVQVCSDRFEGGVPSSWANISLEVVYTVDVADNNLRGVFPRSSPQVAALVALQQMITGSGGISNALATWDGSDPGEAGPKTPPKYCRLWKGVACNSGYQITALNLTALSIQLPTTASLNFSTLVEKLQPLSSSLRVLDAATLHLTGDLPESLAAFSRLEVLMLNGNKGLTGSLPDLWSALTALQAVDISSTSIGGNLPPSWASLQELRAFRAADCSGLSGQLPLEWGILRSLEELVVTNSQLGGALPAWTDAGAVRAAGAAALAATEQAAEKAVDADLSPASVEQRPTHVRYSSGRVGPQATAAATQRAVTAIKAALAAAPAGTRFMPLRVFDLSGNKLTGQLVPGWSLFEQLQRLILARNTLSGPLPDGYARLTTLTALDLSANSFVGMLPSTWVSMRQLVFLDVSGNALVSPVPRTLPFMAGDGFSLKCLVLVGNTGMDSAELASIKSKMEADSATKAFKLRQQVTVAANPSSAQTPG